MDIITCVPGVFNIAPDNLEQERSRAFNDMVARINGEEKYIRVGATDYEKSDATLQRILKKFLYDLETSLHHWDEWVRWRQENKVDSITTDQIKHEISEGILAWRGHNKQNMPCLVVTGRLLDPINRAGTPLSFKNYILKTVEDQMVEHMIKQADGGNEASSSPAPPSSSSIRSEDGNEESSEKIASCPDKVCVIYDRRDLTFENIDPNLYQFCKKTILQMRDFYNDRLGVVYVVHSNFLFWSIFMVFVRPLLFITSQNSRFILVEKPEELLQHFDEDQLLLSSVNTGNDAASVPSTQA